MATQSPLAVPADCAKSRSGAQPWYVLAVLLILWVVSYLDRQVLGLLVAPIRKDLSLSDFDISLLQGLSFALCYGIAGLPFGWLADRYRRRPIIFCGITIWALAAAGGGLANSFGELFVARMLVGVGEAALAPAAYSILADVFPRHRLSLAVSIVAMGGALGSGIAYTLSGAILELTESGRLNLPFISALAPWKQVFIITGIPGLFLGFLVFTFPEPVRRGIETSGSPNSAIAGYDSSMRALGAYVHRHWRFYAAHIGGFTMFSIANNGFLAWAAEYMRRRFGWSPIEIGTSFGTAHSTAVFAAFLLGGVVVDKLFSRGMRDAHLRVFIVFAIVSIPLAAWTMLTSSPWVFLVVSTLWGLFTISFGGGAAAALQIVTPSQFRGRVSSLYLVIIVVTGMTVGPSSVAAITQFVLNDEARLGTAMLITLMVAYPVAALLLASGLKTMRLMVKSQASDAT